MKRLILPILICLFTTSWSHASGYFSPKIGTETFVLVCPPPTGLAAIDITSNSAKLKWDAVNDALGGYQVQIRLAGTSGWTTLPTNTNSVVVQSLLPNTTYQWHVHSICDPGGSGGDYSDILSFTTLQTATNCAVPVDLSTTNITATSAQLNWNAVAGALGYEVQIRVGTSTVYTSYPVNAPPFIAQNLAPLTVHHWRVRAICDANAVSDWTVEKEFKTLELPVPCSVPTNPHATNVTQNSALLAWTGTNTALGYQIDYQVAGTNTWTTILTNGNITSILVGNLSPNTNYIWRVRAKCDGQIFSDWSALSDFKTLAAPANCAAPGDLNITNITATSAQLSWSAVAGALGYEVNYHILGGTWQVVAVAGSTTTFVINNLTPNAQYFWRVRAKCDGQIFSDWSAEEDFWTLSNSNSCPKPVDLVATNITATSAQLSWNPVAGALGYEVNYAIAGTTNWQSVTVIAPAATVVVNNLAPQTGYIWRVRAKCDGQIFSDWSNVQDFKTLTNPNSCPKPVDLAVTNITATSAQLSWNAVAGALGYEVNYAVAGTTNWQSIAVVAPTTTVLVNNLAPQTGYIWRVRTKCDGQIFSDWSNVQDFKTLENTNSCPKPVDLAVTNITATSAQLSWNPVAGALSYEVNYALSGTSNWVSVFVTAPTSTVLINNLLPSSVYRWRVRTKCDGQIFSDWTDVHEFKTLSNPAGCVAPHEFAVKDLTHHSALLVWNKVAGAYGYELQYRKVGTPDWITISIVGNPPVAQFLVDNLAPEMDYEWRVRTICDPAQFSDWGPTQLFMTLPEPGSGTPCAAPTDFHVTDVTHYSAKFSWNAAPGAFSYQITYHVVNSAVWKTIIVAGNPLPTMFLLLNLAPNTHYEAKIRSHCGTDTNSDWSALVDFTTLAAPPCSTPSDLQANDITSYSANLSWSAVPGATLYRVRYRKFGTQTWKIKTITGNPPATTTSISPLPASSTIEWQVKAICGPGSEGDWSPLATFQTLATPPCDAPTGLTFADLTPTSVIISWNGSTGAISYKIRYRKISPSGQPGPWKIKNITGTPPATMTTVDGLTPESTYEVQSRAICGPISQSFWSTTSTFTTPAQFGDPNDPDHFVQQKSAWGGALVSPNPTADLTAIRFESTTDGLGEMRIFDLNGKIVFTTQLAVNQGLNEVELSLGNFAPGIYVLRLQGSTDVLTEKIQVIR